MNISEIKMAKIQRANARLYYLDMRKQRDEAELARRLACEEKRRVTEITREREKEIIETMLMLDTGDGMTAKEIHAMTEGAMSLQEVVGNLNAILRTGDKVKKRDHFPDGRIKLNDDSVTYRKNRFDISRYKISSEIVEQCSYSVACDENGAPLKGAEPIPHVSKTRTYKFYPEC